jgi:hypothetical protein
MASPKFERRPYAGSCHCGTIKYVAYLRLPVTGKGEWTVTSLIQAELS